MRYIMRACHQIDVVRALPLERQEGARERLYRNGFACSLTAADLPVLTKYAAQ